MLRAMKEAEHSHLVASVDDFVDRDVREWGKRELSGSGDPAETTKLRKFLQSADALYHRQCDTSGCVGPVLCDVVADAFEIIRSFRRPADAHHPR